MPMDFPDLRSIKFAAQLHNFREIIPNESEDEYRTALADHVAKIDFIESEEIRNKKGWDMWSNKETLNILNNLSSRRKGGKS